MAKIKSIEAGKEKLLQLNYNSMVMNEYNDCSVRAIAAATGATYTDAHKACAAYGRANRHGMSILGILAAIRLLGYESVDLRAEDMIAQYPAAHKTLKSITTHHPQRFSKVWENGKTYFFVTKGHIAAVVNGVNYDWSQSRCLKVLQLIEIKKIN